MSVTNAVTQFVKDGDYLSAGGFGTNRFATSALHEILRQKKKNLGLAGHTTTHDFQVLAAGVPIIPARSMLGTDTMLRSAAKEIECPFTGKKLAAIPALYPDVSVIQLHESDCCGNCRINGISVADADLARASKRVIITTERIIDNSEIREHPESTIIPAFCVDAVCHVPYGSYPGNMSGEYFSEYMLNSFTLVVNYMGTSGWYLPDGLTSIAHQ
jgi:glutaconate CoA-transferase, subunit A